MILRLMSSSIAALVALTYYSVSRSSEERSPSVRNPGLASPQTFQLAAHDVIHPRCEPLNEGGIKARHGLRSKVTVFTLNSGRGVFATTKYNGDSASADELPENLQFWL
jgi:hypothetical protein